MTVKELLEAEYVEINGQKASAEDVEDLIRRAADGMTYEAIVSISRQCWLIETEVEVQEVQLDSN